MIDITAIHIGTDNISWVLINSLNKSVLGWDFIEYALDKGSLYDSLSVVSLVFCFHSNLTFMIDDPNIINY